MLPSWVVTRVSPRRRAARSPSYAHGYYDRDNAAYRAWDAIGRDREAFGALGARTSCGAGSPA